MTFGRSPPPDPGGGVVATGRVCAKPTLTAATAAATPPARNRRMLNLP